MVTSHRRYVSRRALLTFAISLLFGLNLNTWYAAGPRLATTGGGCGQQHLGQLDAAAPAGTSGTELVHQKRRSKELEAFYETIEESQRSRGRNGFDYIDVVEPQQLRKNDAYVPPQYRYEIAPPAATKDDPVPPTLPPGDQFLYVGVMTAGKYLDTRCQAIVDTWQRHVPGRVEFYVGENARDVEVSGASIRRLASVDDNAYPPQKKSFLLLKAMYEMYLNSG